MIYDGLIVLYIVCKNKNVFLCRYLMFNNKIKIFFLNEILNRGWNVVYYVVVVGSMEILNFFEDFGFDIIVVIENKLNIFDVVCFYNWVDLCKILINWDDLCLLLVKEDGNGWIIVYIVVMVGNSDIFECLIEKNVNIEVKIK